MIETYEEHDERQCPLCDEPVLRGHEVVVVATDNVVHEDCYRASITPELQLVGSSR